jgi:hypothetical protein
MSVRPLSQVTVDIPDTGFYPSSGPEGMHKEPCCRSTHNLCQSTRLSIPQWFARSKIYLEERVPRNDAEEALEALASGLDDLVGETVGEDFAGERGDVDSRRLALQDIAEGFKV